MQISIDPLSAGGIDANLHRSPQGGGIEANFHFRRGFHPWPSAQVGSMQICIDPPSAGEIEQICIDPLSAGGIDANLHPYP